MTPTSTKFAVQNSLLFVRDPALLDLPFIWDIKPVWSTPSCVAVACRPDCDGETEIIIGPSKDVGPGRPPVFEGSIKSPSRLLIVETAHDQEVLRQNVPNTNARVRIWTDGHLDTGTVIIGLE